MKSASPKASEIRELRETYGLSQSAAAGSVYSALRSWQNWEAGEVAMHPAIWAWFKHVVTGIGTQPSESGNYQPTRPTKYLRQSIQFWWNARDNSIHVTAPYGTAPKLHTRFIFDPTSERWHRSMFTWLTQMLEQSGKPAPKLTRS